ncbi:hypothetical protein THRCLA_11980, partial [Thraustotheca clavata]
MWQTVSDAFRWIYLTTLPVAIEGLRILPASGVNTLLTPYCWADFEKNWSLAHSYKRASRCWKRDTDNAAVYLEAVLRNINLKAWLVQNSEAFMELIAIPIEQSGGQYWVDQLLHNNGTLYQMQYGNSIQTGISE